jgi:hypothetical protein
MLAHAGDDVRARRSIEVAAPPSRRSPAAPDARRRQLRRHTPGDGVRDPVETRSEAAPPDGDDSCDAVDLVS